MVNVASRKYTQKMDEYKFDGRVDGVFGVESCTVVERELATSASAKPWRSRGVAFGLWRGED